MIFRKKILESGTEILIGKDAESNDELMKEYKGKNNIILHTKEPGSPFGVIQKIKPSKEEIHESGAIVAKYSQDWRNKKSDIFVDVFTGKDTEKKFWMNKGTWKVKNVKTIRIKKEDILQIK